MNRILCQSLGWLLAAIASIALQVAPALSDGDVEGGAEGDSVFIAAVKATESGLETPSVAHGDAGGERPTYVEYRWISVCTTLDSAPEGAVEMDCAAARSCASSPSP